MAWLFGPSSVDAQSANESLARTPMSDDAPDRRFWTAYDHFMVEREARAMRNAYIGALVARGWRWLTARLDLSKDDR
jgi:hypothetical protein